MKSSEKVTKKKGFRQKVGGCSSASLLMLGAAIVLSQAINVFVMHFTHSWFSPTLLSQIPMYNEEATKIIGSSRSDNELPRWISDYIKWHTGMRNKFPGKELFTNPNAPKLLIRVCLGLCGGLNDRLGQLPWDLYLANQTQRVLLINWSRPRALEFFLTPNKLDWSIPHEVEGWGFDDMKKIRPFKQLFDGMPYLNPDRAFVETQVDEAILRATSGEYKDERILRFQILGHIYEDNLEQRLAALGEADMIHRTKTFGNIFRALFKPSLGVQRLLDSVYSELNLTAGQYTAVHCRVRHPKARPPGKVVTGKAENYPADKSGLPFHGDNKDFAVSIATHAVQCARTLSLDKVEPIYFFADSNDLVQHMVHVLSDKELVARNATFRENKVDAKAIRAVSQAHLVAREMSEENAHIDRQKGREAPAYYATFVDLYLAMGARCITYGIGFYAVFASKLSGIQCKLLYQEEEWGGRESKRSHTKLCTQETYKNLPT